MHDRLLHSALRAADGGVSLAGRGARVTLVYAGETVRPHPILPVTVTTTPSFPTTGRLRLHAWLNGTTVTFVNGDTMTYFNALSAGSVQSVRLAQQFDASSYATGLYPMKVTVQDSARSILGVWITDGMASLTWTLPIVNGSGSAIARGWGIKGLQRVYALGNTLGYMIVNGDGSFCATKPLYTIEFSVVAIPSYFVIRHRVGQYRPWQWAALGGMLFAITVPLWIVRVTLLLRFDTNMLFIMALACIAGCVAFFRSRRFTSHIMLYKEPCLARSFRTVGSYVLSGRSPDS